MAKRLYGKRDIVAQGQKYIDHITAMTAEELFGKSNIAAELAHRDIEIEDLRADNKRLREALEELVFLKDHKDKNGKTDLYRMIQPDAWESARDALQGDK